ncbi:MAG: FAD-binding protein [Opitutaceae bacterium]
MKTSKLEMTFEPVTPEELVETIRAYPRVVPVGAGTKPRLADVGSEFARVSTLQLSGIVEYEPSEFTFTALAGTPLAQIVAALAERGQYLPFDPMLVAGGATLGGTIAAGLSGPGRFRFGGLRDFILGVQFADGEGRLLRMGGKVVKNAAGFDLPKFFVGSLGRFGILVEVTFKVFPRPAELRTLRIDAPDAATKERLIQEAAGARWEIDALDAPAADDVVFMRIGGPAVALDALTKEILARWPGVALTGEQATHLWETVGEMSWVHPEGNVVKLALTPSRIAEFIAVVRGHAEARGWVSAGGNTGYLSVPAGSALPTLAWPAVTLSGEAPLWPGEHPRFEVMQAVKAALDPNNRFPKLDE